MSHLRPLLTVAHLAPLFTLLQARTLEWEGSFLSPGVFLTPGINPRAPFTERDFTVDTRSPPGCGYQLSKQSRTDKEGVVSYFCILKSNGNLINIMD